MFRNLFQLFGGSAEKELFPDTTSHVIILDLQSVILYDTDSRQYERVYKYKSDKGAYVKNLLAVLKQFNNNSTKLNRVIILSDTLSLEEFKKYVTKATNSSGGGDLDVTDFLKTGHNYLRFSGWESKRAQLKKIITKLNDIKFFENDGDGGNKLLYLTRLMSTPDQQTAKYEKEIKKHVTDNNMKNVEIVPVDTPENSKLPFRFKEHRMSTIKESLQNPAFTWPFMLNYPHYKSVMRHLQLTEPDIMNINPVELDDKIQINIKERLDIE